MQPNPFPGLRIDRRERLYIERRGHSVDAISFEDVLDITNALAGRLRLPSLAISSSELGSVDAYRRYRLLLTKAAGKLPTDESWYHPRTPAQARQALETARIARYRVRLYYGDPATGRDAMEIVNTVGYIGRRGHDLPLPVLLAQPGDRHGTRIHSAALVRVAALDHHVDLWQHPRYHLPRLDCAPLLDGQARVVIDGTLDVDFNNDREATKYLRFVRGETNASPLNLATA